jgi:transposase
MAAAVPVTRVDLSATDLRRLSKKQKNPLIVRRMLAIALVLEGVDRQSAAEACGMDRQTLRDWVHRYNTEGIAGLRERRTTGNKSPLGPEAKQALAARFGIHVHERTVGKYLTALGYRRLSVRPQHPDADPEAQEAFKKTSPKLWAKRSRRRPKASPSKSGSKTRRGSASRAP